jgi:LPXTG-site transpeptidase (sortase) family protein
MLVAGMLGLISGVALLSLGVYEMTSDGTPRKAAAQVPLISFSNDPGAIYDRPLRATPTPTPAPTAVPVAGPAVPPPLRDSPYRLIIQKIGVDAPVVTYGLDAEQVPEVPYNKYDVAWYDFSAKPGTGGNAVFAGHVTWDGQAVFYSLDQLAAGDDVFLEATDGTKVYYKVTEVFLIDPTDPNSLAVMGPSGADTMTIITCGGAPFYIGGVFRYDYSHRLIVRAALTGVELVTASEDPSTGG